MSGLLVAGLLAIGAAIGVIGITLYVAISFTRNW